jgi:phospholipid transport system substrate-binding protein
MLERPVHSFPMRRRKAPRFAGVVAALAVLVSLALDPGPVLADEAGSGARGARTGDGLQPLEVVRSSVARVVAIVQAQAPGVPLDGLRRAQIRHVADEMFDFGEMSRRTLAQHWDERSPEEQQEFVRLFVDLLERSYLTTIGNYPLASITYQGESISGSYAQVRSRLLGNRHQEVPIEYRLSETNGRWAVYDVVADGISLVSSYRSQFSSIIRSSSFADLLETLRNRRAQLLPRQAR